MLEQALGQGDAPISPRKPLPDYIVEKRFPEPVATENVIAMNLYALAAMLITAMDIIVDNSSYPTRGGWRQRSSAPTALCA